MRDDTWLYRAYGEDGRLLYVGITADVAQRLKQHSWRAAPWVDQLASVVIDGPYRDRADARAAEDAAIRTEWPLHNRAASIDPDQIDRANRAAYLRTMRAATSREPQPLRFARHVARCHERDDRVRRALSRTQVRVLALEAEGARHG